MARKNKNKKQNKNPGGGKLARHATTAVSRHAARQRFLRQTKKDLLLENKEYLLPTEIPETTCECCASKSKADDDFDEAFDENGYPIIKKNFLGSILNPKANIGAGGRYFYPTVSSAPAQVAPVDKPFRFLDLPAELRTYIYELACTQDEQPVCVNDALLRPSLDMPDPEHVLRECKAKVICLPCQLHDTLGTTTYGLTRASKQLHAETALIPYKVNMFSVHNIYYLQAFLQIIGEDGRKQLKQLRFDWKLPEEGAQALELDTNFYKAYNLLLECKNLSTLWIDMDVVNLLSWREDGTPRSEMLQDMSQTPSIVAMYWLRGLTDVKVRWKHVDGLVMEPWVKWMIGMWRISRDSPSSEPTPVDAEMEWDKDSGWCSIHWKRGEQE